MGPHSVHFVSSSTKERMSFLPEPAIQHLRGKGRWRAHFTGCCTASECQQSPNNLIERHNLVLMRFGQLKVLDCCGVIDVTSLVR